MIIIIFILFYVCKVGDSERATATGGGVLYALYNVYLIWAGFRFSPFVLLIFLKIKYDLIDGYLFLDVRNSNCKCNKHVFKFEFDKKDAFCFHTHTPHTPHTHTPHLLTIR